jgi:hypothetical protein
LLISIMTASCSNEIISEKEEITQPEISLVVNDKNNNSLYHVYFKNSESYTKSSSVNLNKEKKTKSTLKFGNYSVYALSFAPKTTSNYCCDKFWSTTIDITESKTLLAEPVILKPDAEIIYENGEVQIIIHTERYNDIFSISSLSLKQGSDKVRSLNFIYNEKDKNYSAKITLYRNGEWYYNISFTLKAGAIDEKTLEKDGIKLSTTAFQDISLGTFNFIK